MKVIGLDLDNTIISYDDVFYMAALNEGLIKASVSKSKTCVKQAITESYGDAAFTQLQGQVYGTYIGLAVANRGVKDVVERQIAKGNCIYIVSHKTRFPIAGKRVDLREKARLWLEDNSIVKRDGGINPSNIFFESTVEDKIARIERLGCTYFVDDLAKVLDLLSPSIRRIHFNKGSRQPLADGLLNAADWSEVNKYLDDD